MRTKSAIALLMLAPQWVAFAQQQPRLTFDVESVKPSKSDATNSLAGYAPGGRFTAENAPLRFLIAQAYRVKEFQLPGGPGWIDTARYDIAAKAEGNVPPDQMWLMLRNLLEDRFQLKLHRESKKHALYALTAAKTGLKLRTSAADCDALAHAAAGARSVEPSGTWSASARRIADTKISMAQFTDALSSALEYPVIDKTRFNGAFDVHIEWTSDETQGTDAADGPSIFTALQEQLGLKLESAKGPVDFLVIDRVEKLSEN